MRTQNQPKESKPKDTAHQKKLQRQAEKVCRQTLRKPTRRLLIMHRRRFLFYFIFATTAHSVEGKHEPILESGLAAIHLGVQPTRDDCRRRAWIGATLPTWECFRLHGTQKTQSAWQWIQKPCELPRRLPDNSRVRMPLEAILLASLGAPPAVVLS